MDILKKQVDNLTGKHIKQILQRLENNAIINPTVRKIILDELNDFRRELLLELGYTEEQ